MKAIVGLFSFLILTACMHGTTSPDNRHGISKLYVASVFGDEMPITVLGTTVLNNRDMYASAKNWRLEKFIQEEYKVQLYDTEIKARPYDPDAGKLAELNKNYPAINDYLVSAARSRGIKHLVVLEPMGHSKFALYKPGYGVFCRSAFGLRGEVEIYWMYRVRIWDTESNSMIFTKEFTPADTMRKTGARCDDVAKNTLVASARQFKPYLEASLAYSIQQTLQGAGLIP